MIKAEQVLFDRARRAAIEENYDEAERILDGAIDLHPEVRPFLSDHYDQLMGEIALGQKEYDRALKLLKDVTGTPPDNVTAPELALAYLGLGQIEAARSVLGTRLGPESTGIAEYEMCGKYLLPKWQTGSAKDLVSIARFMMAALPAASPLDYLERRHSIELYKQSASANPAYYYVLGHLDQIYMKLRSAYGFSRRWASPASPSLTTTCGLSWRCARRVRSRKVNQFPVVRHEPHCIVGMD